MFVFFSSAQLYDGFRHLKTYGRWSWTGMTYDELRQKYEKKIREEYQGQNLDPVEFDRLVARRILIKSCQTNKHFDQLTGVKKRKRVGARSSSSSGATSFSSAGYRTTDVLGAPPLLSHIQKVLDFSKIQEQTMSTL